MTPGSAGVKARAMLSSGGAPVRDWRVAAPMLIAMLLAFAPVLPTSEGTAASSPIPLAPGTWWEYRESYSEHHTSGIEAIEEAVTRFRVHQGRHGPYVSQAGGADPVSGPVERGLDFIRLAPWTGEDALPLPLEVGRVARGATAQSQGFKVEAFEDITVPAGTFRAFRCAIRTWTNVSVLWIAPGVGVVKETQGTPGRRPEIERELVRWSGMPASR